MEGKKVGRCRRCGRALTNEKSIVRGYGSTCWAKLSTVKEVLNDEYNKEQTEESEAPVTLDDSHQQ